MDIHRSHATPLPVERRRRRPARRLELSAPPPNARTATAMDDVQLAEQLVADVLELVDFGLVTPLSDPCGQARYAITEVGDPDD